MAPVNEQTTIRECEVRPQCPGARASLAPRLLFDNESRVEFDDPARVVVPSDQREPRDPSVPSYASFLLDNEMRYCRRGRGYHSCHNRCQINAA